MVSSLVLGVLPACLLCLASEEVVLRPLYIISHLSNSKVFIDDMLSRGANGVELDTQFNSNCTPSRFFHGGSCNCGHEVNGSCGCDSEYYCAQEGKIVQLLQYLRDVANPEKSLYRPTFTGFVWLDLKLPYHDEMEEGGKYFGNVLLDDIFNSDGNGSRLHLGLEQYNIHDAPFVRGVSDQIKERGRADLVDRFVTIANNVEHTDKYLKLNQNVTPAIWLAEGSSDCGSYNQSRTKAAVARRDSTTGMAKVARWTVDSEENIRKELRQGVDVIMTNFPERARQVLMEPEFKTTYRQATALDKPSHKIIGLPRTHSSLPLASCNGLTCLTREIPDNGSTKLKPSLSQLLLPVFTKIVTRMLL